MGDRYTITIEAEALRERFNADVPDRYEPRYNAAPTQVLPVITQGSKGISFFYWGQIPGRSKNRAISPKLLFIEKETLTEKLSFREALLKNRCLIPADGYYDWKKISKKGKVPHRFIFENNAVVSFAGIWEEFEDDEENIVHTFRIITTPSNRLMASINDRMPAVLTRENEKAWLDIHTPEEKLIESLTTYPADKMGLYTVSPRISDLNNEGPSLVRPMAPADQFGNYSLFD